MQNQYKNLYRDQVGAQSAQMSMSDRACEASKPMRDVSPVESALDLLNSNIEEAHRQAGELIERLTPVSDCGALTGSDSDGVRSPSVSRVESRIEDANCALVSLTDMLRSARLGLRI